MIPASNKSAKQTNCSDGIRMSGPINRNCQPCINAKPKLAIIELPIITVRLQCSQQRFVASCGAFSSASGGNERSTGVSRYMNSANFIGQAVAGFCAAVIAATSRAMDSSIVGGLGCSMRASCSCPASGAAMVSKISMSRPSSGL